MVIRLPARENIFIVFLPIKIVTSGHQRTAYAGNMNHKNCAPVVRLTKTRNSMITRLPAIENPMRKRLLFA
jgi:hypothetical protein